MILLAIIIIFITLVSYYFHRKHQFFVNLGIPHEPGYFPFGSWKVWTAFMGKASLFQIPEELYDKYPNDRVFGYFKPFGKPVFVIKDYELAKRVMIKDFDHFVDRGFLHVHPESNPYMKYSMTIQNGEAWRVARGYVTPLFTSGKLKTMYPLITETVQSMVEYLKKRNGQEIDGKDIFEKYTIELLGDLGCGVKAQIFKEGANEFYERSKLLVGTGDAKLLDVMRFVFILLFPDLSYNLKMKLIGDEDLDYFVQFIQKRIDMRNNEQVRRNDFIDLLMDSVRENAIEEVDKFVICNSFVLFFVGSDTSSGALALICNYLAVHPNVQDKLFDELSDAENLDYNTLTNLKYMTCIIMEATRLMNFNFFTRRCTKEYTIPELKLTIPLDTDVAITCGKLMREEELFLGNPLMFDPERHVSNASMTSANFLPFGIGPRSCIGMRLANIIIRTALAHLVLNFKIEPTENTDRNWSFEPKSPGGIAKNELVYKIVQRE